MDGGTARFRARRATSHGLGPRARTRASPPAVRAFRPARERARGARDPYWPVCLVVPASPTAQVRGGAVRSGSRGRLKLGLHAPLSSGYLACSKPAAPTSVSSWPEFQKCWAEAAELALLCCWEGAWSVLLRNRDCPVHCKNLSPKFSNTGLRATQHPAHHTLQGLRSPSQSSPIVPSC